MRKFFLLIITILLGTSMTSCMKSRGGQGGEVTGIRGRAWNEPQPYGMVLVKRGSIDMGTNDPVSQWGDQQEVKGVSVDAFWMDEKEVSNALYRQFVQYVRDSIIRERLADPNYGDNEDFKITVDKHGEEVTPHLNWNKAIPWLCSQH